MKQEAWIILFLLGLFLSDLGQIQFFSDTTDLFQDVYEETALRGHLRNLSPSLWDLLHDPPTECLHT